MSDLQKCDDCGTEYIVACGPPGCIQVPACWCADDKRKAELREVQEELDNVDWDAAAERMERR